MKEEDYSDIINQPYPFPMHHPRMSMYSRAAQFSAFEALDGHSQRIQDAEKEEAYPLPCNDDDILDDYDFFTKDI